MTRASLQDMATLKHHGYKVERWSADYWMLTGPDGESCSVNGYGVSETQWEAVAEGLKRIGDES